MACKKSAENGRNKVRRQLGDKEKGFKGKGNNGLSMIKRHEFYGTHGDIDRDNGAPRGSFMLEKKTR